MMKLFAFSILFLSLPIHHTVPPTAGIGVSMGTFPADNSKNALTEVAGNGFSNDVEMISYTVLAKFE